MKKLEKFTYFSQFFWFCLFLFILYIPRRNDGDGVLGISRILEKNLNFMTNQVRCFYSGRIYPCLLLVAFITLLESRISKFYRGIRPAINVAVSRVGSAAQDMFNRIRETWLFQKMKRAFTLEGQAIMFFLQIGFLIASFGLFVWFYKLMFGEVEKGNLVNPLQVIAQVSCFLFYFRYPARVRHLLLLCFFLSLLSSLHLKGIDGGVLSFVLLLFLIVIFFFPLDYAHLIVFFGYFLDQGLAKWGFYLAFQQVGYHALSFFFERGQSSATPKKGIFSFLFLLLIQTLYGLVHFREFYFAEPLKLAALLSGACIIFISLAKRAMWAFLLTFLFYFILSLFIGVMSSPGDKATIWGIPHGIIIFFFLHIWVFFGFFFFKDSLPRRKQPLVPLFFGGVFFLLGYFPELAWLEKWIEGIDLLLLVLGLFSFIEGEESSQRHPKKTKGIMSGP